MEILVCAAAGFVLDLILGDPEGFPHPVVLMGAAIAKLEKVLRGLFSDTPEGRRKAGIVLAAVLPAGTVFISMSALYLAGAFTVLDTRSSPSIHIRTTSVT